MSRAPLRTLVSAVVDADEGIAADVVGCATEDTVERTAATAA